MNKFLFAVLAILIGGVGAAQTTIGPYNTGWLPVNSYSGATSNNLIFIPFHINSNQGNQMKRWSLTFRVANPIVNSEGKVFPAEKLSFKLASITGSQANEDGKLPSIANLQPLTNNIPYQFSNSFLVNNSPYSLQMKQYFNMNMQYDVAVEGGAYLDTYKSWQNYTVNLVIELWNSKMETMDSKTVSFQMQVYPSGVPPQPVQNSIIIDGAAKNVLLEFKTPADYANGVSKTLSRAVSVTSSTGYSVTVQSMYQNLTTSSNQQLPVNLIRMISRDHSTQAVTGNVVLSTASQSVANSNTAATEPRFFDLTYATQGGENSFFNRSYEQYSGTLIFSLIPQ